MKLIIFDCDGTLIDSQNIIFASMAKAFTDHGLTVPGRADVLGIVGLSLPQAVAVLLPGQDPDLVQSVSESYKDAFGHFRFDPAHIEPMFDGVRALVVELAARDDVLLGIATGKSRRGVDHFVEREGLQNVFVTIQTADDAPSKPHPAMIEQAMTETGCVVSDTVMIGDTSFDMMMARAAGVRAQGVSWGYHPVPVLRQSGAHHVADTVEELALAVAGGFPERSDMQA